MCQSIAQGIRNFLCAELGAKNVTYEAKTTQHSSEVHMDIEVMVRPEHVLRFVTLDLSFDTRERRD